MRLSFWFWILVFLFICLPEYSNCQAKPAFQHIPNTLVIIGTIHKETKYITFDTLLRAIERVKPDIILLESEPRRYKHCKVKKGIAEKILSLFLFVVKGIEADAAIRYKETYASVCLSSFDVHIPNRNKYVKRLVKEAGVFSKEINSTFSKKEFSGIDSVVFEKYALLDHYIHSRVEDSGNLIIVNSKPASDSLKKMNQIEKDQLKEIVAKYPSLKQYNNWYNEWIGLYMDGQFRNEGMCKNIAKIVTQNENKKILVLVGYVHKHFVQDYFLNNKRLNVTLKEFYDF